MLRLNIARTVRPIHQTLVPTVASARFFNTTQLRRNTPLDYKPPTASRSHPPAASQPVTTSPRPSATTIGPQPAPPHNDRPDDHPLPDDMPREEYAKPAMYAFGLMGRIFKYIIYGVVGIAAGLAVTIEGLHMVTEHIFMGYPARVDPTQVTPTSDLGLYAWPEETSSWTGGASGGTSSRLGFSARHLLRSSWLAQEFGSDSHQDLRLASSHTPHSNRQDAPTKGMIGAGGTTGPSAATAVNNAPPVDPSFLLAESYMNRVIEKAIEAGIQFPTLSRDAQTDYTDLSALKEPPPPPDQVALDLLARQAELSELIGRPSSLVLANENYEKVLRSVLLRPPVNELDGTLQKAELLRLAKKLGDVNAKLGDTEKAIGWWTWGLSRSGIDVSPVLPAGPAVGPVAQPSSGWFSGWFGSTRTAVGGPSDAMQHTLAENSHFVTPPQGELMPTSPPPIQRAVIALLGSITNHFGTHSQFDQAKHLQNIAINLIQSDETTAPVPPTAISQSPAGALQRLWLNQRLSLFGLNMTEIAHVQGEPLEAGLDRLGEATWRAEQVIQHLSAGTSSIPSPPTDTTSTTGASTTPYLPANAIPLQSFDLNSRYGQSSKVTPPGPLTRPASQLLRDAKRTAAEGWSLKGLLYEQAAKQKSSSSEIVQRQALQELALDCHERAVGWSRIAAGESAERLGKMALDDDALSVFGRDGGKTATYWRNYMRVRGKLQAEVMSMNLKTAP